MRRRPDGRTERIAVVQFRVTGDADDFDLVTQVCLETAAYEIERWTCSRMSLAPTGPRPNRRRNRRTRRGYFDSSHLLLTVRERVPQRDASNASRPNASDHWPWPRARFSAEAQAPGADRLHEGRKARLNLRNHNVPKRVGHSTSECNGSLLFLMVESRPYSRFVLFLVTGECLPFPSSVARFRVGVPHAGPTGWLACLRFARGRQAVERSR